MSRNLRAFPSNWDMRTRGAQADVDRAMEMLGIELTDDEARIGGSVHEVRRRLDALLDDLFPLPRPRSRLARLLHRMGFTPRARAADAALDALLRSPAPGVKGMMLRILGGWSVAGRVSPEEAARNHIVIALQDAYDVLAPYEPAAAACRIRVDLLPAKCCQPDGNTPA